MLTLKPVAALTALAGIMAPALSHAADDIASLRAELQALKSEYTERVGALESRIEQLESTPVAASPAETPPAPSSPNAGGGNAATAFNPAVSLIIGGSYTDTSRDPQDWHLQGFIPSGGE